MELPDLMNDPRAAEAVRRALDEDVGSGDVTTLALVDPGARAVGAILSREPCRVAGGAVAAAVLQAVDPAIECAAAVADGRDAAAGETLLTISARRLDPHCRADGAELHAADVRIATLTQPLRRGGPAVGP